MAARIAWIGNVIVLVSYFLIAVKLPVYGLIFAFISNLTFLYYGILTGHRGFIFTNVLLACFSLYGIYNWIT